MPFVVVFAMPSPATARLYRGAVLLAVLLLCRATAGRSAVQAAVLSVVLFSVPRLPATLSWGYASDDAGLTLHMTGD